MVSGGTVADGVAGDDVGPACGAALCWLAAADGAKTTRYEARDVTTTTAPAIAHELRSVIERAVLARGKAYG
jgi:hypothetical protein